MDKQKNSKSIVEIVRATKIYTPDVVALEDISLSIVYGEMVFLTGMSGAGKTTLLKLICGMENPDKGLVEVAGKDLNRIKGGEIPKFRQQIGMAYQDFKLLPDRTVAQNIAMAMEVSYENLRTIKKRVGELLQKLRLEHKHDALAGNLSRGEQQRVTIARAVANSPRLVLADEPTGNLDSKTTRIVMDLFEQCNLSGTTLIIATHDESIYRRSENRILELHSGRLVAPDDRLASIINNTP
ncbi:MAG: cell division ATP-binding protein FtsE [Deltaproteobacteria bacterium]|jgi:cell division transport system ATP-binding protein|nr:cell division ATP-binding protein FtsE [Deltaproteobacteria bacterium]